MAIFAVARLTADADLTLTFSSDEDVTADGYAIAFEAEAADGSGALTLTASRAAGTITVGIWDPVLKRVQFTVRVPQATVKAAVVDYLTGRRARPNEALELLFSVQITHPTGEVQATHAEPMYLEPGVMPASTT